MQLTKALRRAGIAYKDPTRFLFPKESRDVRELVESIPDSTSKDYYYLLLQAAREDLARTLAARPRSGVLGMLKLTLLARFKLMRLKALTTLATAQITEALLRDELQRP